MNIAKVGTASAFFERMMEKIRHPMVKSFFMGYGYPLWIAFSVFVGRAANLEFYFSILDLLIIAVGLLACDTLRPIIPIMTSFLYRISLSHAPGTPIYSDYYFGAKLYILLGVLVIPLASLVYLFIRNKLITLESLKKLPLILPLAGLSLAFLLGGAFYEGRIASDLHFALFQILAFAIIFWLLYLGLRDEDPNELCSYFTFVCAVLASVLILEVAHLYIFEGVITPDGKINEYMINFGWGISNTVASALSVLIPVCFLGVIKGKYHFVYFVIGTLALLADLFTLSRNGALFGCLFYILSVGACCLFGERKKLYRYVALGTAVTVGIILLIFGNDIEHMFSSMIDSGLNDSGRFKLWRMAFDAFLENPLFGQGYYSFAEDWATYASFIPFQAHNTVFQLLQSMGIFGFVAYLVYRAYTLIPFLKKPSVEKLMLLMSIGVLLGESLLDNFIFWFAPTFIYNLAIIIAIKMCEKDRNTEKISLEATEGTTCVESARVECAVAVNAPSIGAVAQEADASIGAEIDAEPGDVISDEAENVSAEGTEGSDTEADNTSAS